jgi:hypothetical protein
MDQRRNQELLFNVLASRHLPSRPSRRYPLTPRQTPASREVGKVKRAACPSVAPSAE